MLHAMKFRVIHETANLRQFGKCAARVLDVDERIRVTVKTPNGNSGKFLNTFLQGRKATTYGDRRGKKIWTSEQNVPGPDAAPRRSECVDPRRFSRQRW